MKNDSPSRFDVHLTAGDEGPSAVPLREDGMFAIAIFGDFSGGQSRAAAVGGAKRRVWRVDRDDLDSAIAGIAPRLDLIVDPNEPPVTVTFGSIDDFHPDRLAERVPMLLRLRELRAEAAAPSRTRSAPAAPKENRRAESAALGLSGGSLLDRIVDNASATDDPAQHIPGTAPQDELSDFVDRAVRGHTIAATSADQRDLVAKIDDVLAATLRVILHHPSYQALEASWRGANFVVRRLDTGESLHVYLVDVARDEVIDALKSDGASRWSLVIGAFSFGPDDVALLSQIADAASAAGAPFIAAGDSRLAGTASFAGDADPDEWTQPVPDGWETLRRSAAAPFLGLALPRFLLRLPYGAKTDPCDVVPFEEMPDGSRDHDAYLWGNPAIACALVIADAVASGDAPATHGRLDGLPLHVVTVHGEVIATPAGEAILSQRAVAHLVDRGLTPLATTRDGDSIVMARIQSVANPPRPLSIPSPMSS